MSERSTNAQGDDAAWNSERVDSSDGVSLLDLLIILAKHKKKVLGIPLIIAIAAIIYSLALPATYTATTKILPPLGQTASSNLLGQLGSLGGLLGAGPALKSPTDLYIGMFRSRTIADNLIHRFDLLKVYGAENASQARAYLEGATKITAGKDGIIAIDVEDQDPKRAADLANAYVDEVSKLTNVLAVTEASQRRLFFERQFAQAKDGLAKAESAARQSLQKGGLVQVEGQSRAMIETTARLRGQITVKEVQIGAMRTFATDQNPSMIEAQKELEAMKRQLAKLEGTDDIAAPQDTRSADRGMDSVRLLRNVKYYETIYELLAKQYELAKLEESKDSSILQVLDPAIPPESRSGPKRRNIVALWTMAGVLIGVLFAFAAEARESANADPRLAQRLQALRRYLAWR